MKQISQYLNLLLIFPILSIAQSQDNSITIQPYLQDATPESIIVKWETAFDSESIVEWGSTKDLGNATSGISYNIDYTESKIHEVKLVGLERFTEYYYRVITENVSSEIFRFKTPPFNGDRSSFNLIAMSDMQYDHNRPDKFKEIINEGVLSYFKEHYNGELSDHLSMVLIPGDLVENGVKINQWRDHFFGPSAALFSEIPLYPVPGNHERNSSFFFKYFSLPENGTPAYAEHWWYKDYGNVRIIGLDSNDGIRDIPSQLEWLKTLLSKTGENDEIDFVFAQLHHPHKSELWIPGETKFSGKVVTLLESFTESTGKPSIHFFGHTHGYSRGQSKDHKHLWVNVASAGGAIDNWGEYEGRDYDEFTVTQDEYGFVLVEVDADKLNPSFTLKRISSGNDGRSRNKEITDEITVWRNSLPPNSPSVLLPSSDKVDPVHILLEASPFVSPKKDAIHAAAQWQVSADSTFIKPVYDSWKQHENWYYLQNRQENDDLTDEQVLRLHPQRNYYCRVRYRDQYLNWSEWSTTTGFTTKSAK
ncbi:MAG: hypothetical protein ACJA01_000236 [Saprospiraceae bacterium]|jgi:hypothetical protein